MSRYLLRGVAQTLHSGSLTQHPIVTEVTQCTRELLELYMCARYKSHDDATLGYMKDAMQLIHPSRNVLFVQRNIKKVKHIVNSLGPELGKN
jgi:hypothetical protein